MQDYNNSLIFINAKDMVQENSFKNTSHAYALYDKSSNQWWIYIQHISIKDK